MTPVIGSLCSGYGGLDMALSAATGGRVAWHVEYDKHPSAILAHRFPSIPNHGDVKHTDWHAVEPVDWLTAGYPCQPFSHAGLRKGADDPRHLWPDVARAIGVLRPQGVLLENVRGHVSLGLDAVLADLAGLGYDARWGLVRASDAGAPHGRARIFIVSTDAKGDQGRLSDGDGLPACIGRREPHSAASNAGGERHGRGKDARGVGCLDGADEGLARQRERTRPEPVDRGAAAAAVPPNDGRERRGPARGRRTRPTDSGVHAADAAGPGLEGRGTVRGGSYRSRPRSLMRCWHQRITRRHSVHNSPSDMGFRPTGTDLETVERLNEQRRQVRLALTGACRMCERPRDQWPMCFRGDRTCSIRCQKTLAAREAGAA